VLRLGLKGNGACASVWVLIPRPPQPQLDGTMSSMARDAIIKAFMTMPEITVFLVSLKVSKHGRAKDCSVRCGRC